MKSQKLKLDRETFQILKVQIFRVNKIKVFKLFFRVEISENE